MIRHKVLRSIIGIAALLYTSYFSFAARAQEARSLKLYHIHTHEKAEIVFWRQGHYDKAGLKQLNHFLRDWRNNKVIAMNPKLFTLVWRIYQKSDSKDYIHVISAYRTAATNEMLRTISKHSGVAKHSQHILGTAMDICLPDVPVAKLRNIALKLRGGGVGYYPYSNIAFVHVDVGPVRKWVMGRKLMQHYKADLHGH